MKKKKKISIFHMIFFVCLTGPIYLSFFLLVFVSAHLKKIIFCLLGCCCYCCCCYYCPSSIFQLCPFFTQVQQLTFVKYESIQTVETPFLLLLLLLLSPNPLPSLL